MVERKGRISMLYASAREKFTWVVDSFETSYPVEPIHIVSTAYDYIQDKVNQYTGELTRLGCASDDYYWPGKYSKTVDYLLKKRDRLQGILRSCSENNVGPFITYAREKSNDALEMMYQHASRYGTHKDSGVIKNRKLSRFWKAAAQYAPSYFTKPQPPLSISAV